MLKKMPKMVDLAIFSGQTVLPYMSISIGQKLVENATINNFKLPKMSHLIFNLEIFW